MNRCEVKKTEPLPESFE